MSEQNSIPSDQPTTDAATPGADPATRPQPPAELDPLAQPEPGAQVEQSELAAQPEQGAQPEPTQQPQRGRAGDRQRRGGVRRGGQRRDDHDESGIESSLVRVYRCAKVVKGGRTFSFGALVVAGDRRGNVGIGYGKANEVPNAVEKATKDARKSMIRVNLKGSTIPHMVRGSSGASTVVLVPALPGSGVKAGKSVRPCCELAGITDVLTKAYGSTSPKNLVKATMAALAQLQSREQVAETRGVELARGAGELAGT